MWKDVVRLNREQVTPPNFPRPLLCDPSIWDFVWQLWSSEKPLEGSIWEQRWNDSLHFAFVGSHWPSFVIPAPAPLLCGPEPRGLVGGGSVRLSGC